MYYKLLNEDGTTPQGYGKWPLPKNGKPGKWLPAIKGDLIPCRNGYHVLEIADLLEWKGPVLARVEIKGAYIRDGNKGVCRQARITSLCEHWNERNLRLIAADCAERVLPLFEREYPQDMRPRNAIEAARKFANGKITAAQLAAAMAAAWAAAMDAAMAAAWDAAMAAAMAAARDAAMAAARGAAWAAAWGAERQWQNERLCVYLQIKTQHPTQGAD